MVEQEAGKSVSCFNQIGVALRYTDTVPLTKDFEDT